MIEEVVGKERKCQKCLPGDLEVRLYKEGAFSAAGKSVVEVAQRRTRGPCQIGVQDAAAAIDTFCLVRKLFENLGSSREVPSFLTGFNASAEQTEARAELILVLFNESEWVLRW